MDSQFRNIYDPRYQRLQEHLPETDDLCLITLKGHLLAEEVLEDILLFHCKDTSVLDDVDISFFLKLRLTQALLGTTKAPKFVWEMAAALNSLRNELSHSLEGDKVEQKLERFLSYCSESTQISTSKDRPSELKDGLRYMLGALSLVETVVKTGKIPPEMEVSNA